MYDVLLFTPKEIAIAYILILSSCILTYPLIKVILTAVGKGLSKWR